MIEPAATVFTAMPTAQAMAFRAGAADANGQPPEHHVATSDGLPCRHCLAMITTGESYLVFAYRPFPTLQPYAETGPVFVHAEPCQRGGDSADLPAFPNSPQYIVRGYGADDRIVYGTGQIVITAQIPTHAARLLANPAIAYAHVRSASNNCFHCRIDRA